MTAERLELEAERRKAEQAIGRLFDVMAALRGPSGCPWDREQTPQSLRGYVLEEAYEAVEAIDAGDPQEICEELGDLLFQVVFQAEIFRDRGDFALGDVAHAIAEKLVRRHPHVFGDAPNDQASISRTWQRLEAEERREKGEGSPSVLAGVPRALPALLRAQKIQERAASVGFDWPSLGGVRAKLDEEVEELDEARASGDAAAIRAELGDLLFTCVNLARFLKIDAEDALREATARFEGRFRKVESGAAEDGVDLRALDIEALEERWQRAKRDAGAA